ncbi:MAG: AraC family transcriptional regulator, partial [Oscillospiraceae bacterium]|nr:AraC family transcriptional regulator [Oscillospiraceae bacterium]
MLEDPKCSVTQAALACGFDNITHFGRVFGKLTGIPPKAY